MRRLVPLLLAALVAGPAAAQPVEVPVIEMAGDGEAATCSGSVVAGLDPQGDGFLAVRSGPGTGYGMIDRLHNGDQVAVFGARGDWLGVSYGTRRDEWPDLCANSGPARALKGSQQGWVHRNWLRHTAG